MKHTIIPILSFFAGAYISLLVRPLVVDEEHSAPTREASKASGAIIADAPARIRDLEQQIEDMREVVHQANLQLYFDREKERSRLEAESRRREREAKGQREWISRDQWAIFAHNVGVGEENADAVRAVLEGHFRKERERMVAKVRGENDPYPNTPPIEDALAEVLTPEQVDHFSTYMNDLRQIEVDKTVINGIAATLTIIPLDDDLRVKIEAVYREDAEASVYQDGLTFRSPWGMRKRVEAQMRQILSPEDYKLWENAMF